MARIIAAMGWSDFSMKYRGSVLGYLWSFMLPLTKFLVIFFIFEPFVGSEIPNYPLYLFLGVVVWEHFSATTSASLAMPFEKAAIIQNVRFPRLILLLIVGWTHIIIFITHLMLFILLAFVFGVTLSLGALYMIVILLQMSFLALGLGGLLSAFVLRYRDLRHLWDMLLTVFFWLTPIMYPYQVEAPFLREVLTLPEKLAHPTVSELFAAFIRFQPLSIILYDARRVLLSADVAHVPSFGHATGITFVCLLVFALGLFFFHRRSRFFLEEY